MVSTDPVAVPDPTWEDAKTYLERDGVTSWTDGDIEDAFDSEQASQLRRCRLPVVDRSDPLNPVRAYVADLTDALNRRVAHNLALRNLPLGVQASISEAAIATNRVGGLDAEVARLEGPYRKVSVG